MFSIKIKESLSSLSQTYITLDQLEKLVHRNFSSYAEFAQAILR